MGSPGTSTPYCDADELKPFIDKRVLAQLLSDTGSPIAGDPFADTTKLPALILAAGGEVESACLVGGKYTPDDLLNLLDNSHTYLCRIIAGILTGMIRERRVVVDEKVIAQHSWAEKQLALIRGGERIFSVAEVQDARTIHNRDESRPAQFQRESITARNYRFWGKRGYSNGC